MTQHKNSTSPAKIDRLATVSYEEEDTCVSYEEEDTCVSYEEEDTCVSYEEEDTCEQILTGWQLLSSPML